MCILAEHREETILATHTSFPFISIDEEKSVIDVAQLMNKNKIRRLAFKNNQEIIVGIINMGDIFFIFQDRFT